MKVGIIGSGPVGQALGTAFVKEGRQVKLGTRKPDDGKVTQWVKRAGPNASAGTFADAAKFADLAVLATKWDAGATENAIKLADPKNPIARAACGPVLRDRHSGGQLEPRVETPARETLVNGVLPVP